MSALTSPPTYQHAVAGTLDPVDVADYLLETLLHGTASAVWIDPIDRGRHLVAIEQRFGTMRNLQLQDGLGDAVLARLALLAGVDLLAGDSQAGTARIRQGDRGAEVLVAIRPAGRGLSGEIRRFDERPTQVSRNPGRVDETPPDIFEPGAQIGAYQIHRTLGRGGMGVVYEVEHAVLGKRFALKVLFGKVLARDPLSARRFVREARAAARVRHPGIVDVTDFGTLGDGRPYLVMELLHGHTLHHILAQGGPLEPVRAVRLARQIASALGAAHKAGVVHRDLTLANVFVRGSGDKERAMLVDFGSASIPDAELAAVPDGPPGTVIGTPHYLSPEQIRALPTDGRSDLYSLGVILHHLITGHPPYDGDNSREIALKHVQAAIPALDSSLEELPAELVALGARLLAKSAADRPASAAEVDLALERIEFLLLRRGWRRWLPA